MATSQRELQKARNAQVGLVMKAYRESFVGEDGTRGLTQDELLRRMAGVSEDYAARYSHATVSRWETGKTHPTLLRIRVFGAALNLEPWDVAGIVLLAGLAPTFDIAMECVASGTGPVVADSSASPNAEHRLRQTEIPRVVRWVVMRYLMIAVGIAAFGYALGFVGWNASWMPVVYVGFALALVVFQHFVLPGVIENLSDFFWVSLFVVLTTPLLQYSPLGMDHYNIYFLADFAGTHYPYMLALLLNLALAFVGTMLFRVPWKWRDSHESAWGNAVRRASWAVLPPVGLVYGALVVISNIAVSVQLTVVMPVLAATFIALLVLRDPDINPTAWDRKFLMITLMVVAIATTTLGLIAILTIYVSPDLPSELPDHNLMHSWEIDFNDLGYTKDEALQKVNQGYISHAMCLFAYMVLVLGAYLLMSVYRLGRGNEQG